MAKNKPVKEFRLGLIKASIWENLFGTSKMYSVSITKSYKDENEWKETTSFSPQDLMVVAFLANQCADYIVKME